MLRDFTGEALTCCLVSSQAEWNSIVIMTFGKHKGKFIEDVPPDYLLWVIDNCDIQPTLRHAIRQALDLSDWPSARKSHGDAGLLVLQVLEPWYRKLAMEFHPDRRGNHVGMVAVNRARDLLLEMMGSAT